MAASHQFCVSGIFKDDYFWDVRRDHSACETLLLVWSQNLYKNGVWHGFYPASEKWIRLSLMPTDGRRKKSSTFAVFDEKLFVIGGVVQSEDASFIRSSRVTYFDLKRYKWQEASPLNVCRQRCVPAVLQNLLYVFGGATNGPMTPTAEAYNPVTKTWKFVSSMPCPMLLVSSVVVQGKFFAVNTFAQSEDWKWKGVVYSPQEDKWTQMPEALNADCSNHPVEFNGQICIRRETRNLKESCVLGYDPTYNTWRLVLGQRALENWSYPYRWPLKDICRGKLLNLDGSLSKIFQKKGDGTVEISIEDMTSGHVVSKSFPPCTLSGIEDSRLLPRDYADLDVEPIACVTVRL